jgi:hypothetical protein
VSQEVLTEYFGFKNNLSSSRLLKCMSSGSNHSSLFWRLAFGSVMEALDDDAKRVLVDGAGAVKSMVKGALTTLGALGAVGAVGSDSQLTLTTRAMSLPLRVTLRSFQCSAPAQL